MKIFGKMLVFFGIVILLFLALSVYSITQSSKLKSNGDNLNSNGVEPSVELTNIASLTENTRVQMLSALTFKNLDATKNALKNLDEIQLKIETLKDNVSSPTVNKAISTFANKRGVKNEESFIFTNSYYFCNNRM